MSRRSSRKIHHCWTGQDGHEGHSYSGLLESVGNAATLHITTVTCFLPFCHIHKAMGPLCIYLESYVHDHRSCLYASHLIKDRPSCSSRPSTWLQCFPAKNDLPAGQARSKRSRGKQFTEFGQQYLCLSEKYPQFQWMIIIFPILSITSITLNGHFATIPHFQTNPSETMRKDLLLPSSTAAPDLPAAVLRTRK